MRGLLPVLRGQWFPRIGFAQIVVLAKPVLCWNLMDKAARGRNDKAPKIGGFSYGLFLCSELSAE